MLVFFLRKHCIIPYEGLPFYQQFFFLFVNNYFHSIIMILMIVVLFTIP